MSTPESTVNLVGMPARSHSAIGSPQRPKRLLNVDDVAQWLDVSEGWVRDHASGRRHPHLRAIKLGSSRSKGLWKFREEDVQEFIEERARDNRVK